MSQKTTSLDIQKGEGSILDIARSFPMTTPRTLDLARHGAIFSDMIIMGDVGPIDLSVETTIQLSRFRTIETLDLALRQIVDPSGIEQGLIGQVPRPRILNTVDPLYIPYGSLDVRSEEMIVSGRRYADIFARTLPTGLVARRAMKGAHTLYTRHRRILATTLIASLILAIPMLSYVAYALTRGYQTLEDLAGVREVNTIKSMIRSARGDFERSSFVFAPFSWIPIGRVDTASRALEGGLDLTRGLDLMAQALPTVTDTGSTITRDESDPLSYRGVARDISPLASLGIDNPTDWIVQERPALVEASRYLTRAGESYSGIVPTGERTTRMQKIGATLSKVAGLLDWSLKNDTNLLAMLGHTNPQRYIVFNQNRDEIRANGGFPGSLLSYTLYKGNILDYRTDDVYYYDWNLYPYKEIPPPGIALLTGNYGLRDVNYYPDFRETLDRANSFVERSGDASVNTAIAIHQGIIEDILDQVGPVSVSGVVVPFDSRNFSLLMSTLVENRYQQSVTPKDVLFQFGYALLSKIQEKNAYLDILDILEKYRKDGEFLIASRDADIHEFVSLYQKKLPWQEPVSQNWIYPVWTSVSGNKSDRYIDRSYQAIVKQIEGCKYKNTITLSNTHIFSKSDTEELKSYFKQFNITGKEEQSKLEFIQGNGKNRAYLRVYVPLGATLVGSGSDISVVSNDVATVFSTLIETPVGATTSKSWKYTLDIPSCEGYTGSVEWIRQPGLRKVKVK